MGLVDPYIGGNNTKGGNYYWKCIYPVDTIKKFVEELPSGGHIVDVCFVDKSVAVLMDNRVICNMITLLGLQKGYVGK